MKESLNQFNESGLDVGYAKFYWATFTKFSLKSDEVILMVLVASLSKRGGWCHASKAFLARKIGVSIPTVYRILGVLRNKGLLEYHPEPDIRGVVRIRPSEIWGGFIGSIEQVYAERKKNEYYGN